MREKKFFLSSVVVFGLSIVGAAWTEGEAAQESGAVDIFIKNNSDGIQSRFEVMERKKVVEEAFKGEKTAIIGAGIAEIVAEQAGKSPDELFFGREEEMAEAVEILLKSFQITGTGPGVYEHQFNDVLVRFQLTTLQFVIDQGFMDEFVAANVELFPRTMARRRKMIEMTGDLDQALNAIVGSCLTSLVVDGVEREPGKFTYTSPYKRVLAVTTEIGMHHITEKEIHELWTVPRYKAYGEMMGVKIHVSDWNDDGVITVSVTPGAA